MTAAPRRVLARLELLGVGRHERRAGDDEAEGDQAATDLKWAGPDRFVEDKDASEDGGQVGGHGGEGDDRGGGLRRG